MAIIKIGTRGSKLALWQAHKVQALLQAQGRACEIVIIKASGDWTAAQGETALPEANRGKAAFCSALEEALLDKSIDCAIHSMKDMDSYIPDGLTIAAALPADAPEDALLLRDRSGALKAAPIQEWPAGTTIGTASPRRGAILRHINSTLIVTPLRGNVDTRLSKLRGDLAAEHDIDATLLSSAGLERLGLQDEIDRILPIDEILPAAAQGVIGVECRVQDTELYAPLNCQRTYIRVQAERTAVKALNGSCHTPIAMHGSWEDDRFILRGQLYAPDGCLLADKQESAPIKSTDEAMVLGESLGTAMLAKQAA